MNKSLDSLTGFISGVELSDEIVDLIQKGEDFAFAMLDIDQLFITNRDYGKEAGDEIFRVIAKSLSTNFPSPCRLFRDTRDQFDIIMPGFTKEEAFLLTEAARKEIHQAKLDYVSAENVPLTQSVSAGISSFPDDGSRVAEVIRKADSALMRAKRNGRNQVCLAREEKMMTKTSHYTQAQLEKLSETAKKQGVGEAVILREALDDIIRKYDE